MVRNFTCTFPLASSEEQQQQASASLAITVSGNVTLDGSMASLQEEYDSLQLFLASKSLHMDDIQACTEAFEACRFGEAEWCAADYAAYMFTYRLFLHIYLPIAIVLVFIGFIFNSLSLFLVTRIRHKFPRHFILQSLAVSDWLLSLFTVLKFGGEFLLSGDDPIITAVKTYGNMFWQAFWLISAFGLVFLAFDCFFATKFPFLYDKRQVHIAVRLGIVLLWCCALLFTGLLIVFEMNYSDIVQYIICGLMVAILLSIVAQSIYAFTLTERIRRFQITTSIRDDKTLKQARRSRLKSSTTIAIIMTCSFISWLPLVIFFFIPQEYLVGENYRLALQMVAVCLICFHMNAVVNPIVYSFRFKDVRAPLRRLMANNRFLQPLVKVWKDDEEATRSFLSKTGETVRMQEARRKTLATANTNDSSIHRIRSPSTPGHAAVDLSVSKNNLPTQLTENSKNGNNNVSNDGVIIERPPHDDATRLENNIHSNNDDEGACSQPLYQCSDV